MQFVDFLLAVFGICLVLALMIALPARKWGAGGGGRRSAARATECKREDPDFPDDVEVVPEDRQVQQSGWTPAGGSSDGGSGGSSSGA